MNVPFLLQPAAKDYLWGGSRLNDDFGKTIPVSPLAETWECSTHPDGLSVVAGGEYAGMTLREILSLHPEYLGSHPLLLTGGKPELPILVKLIDARKDLSIQ
ncbi:MAG: class I mannose-6-phosphate isomerase, partial [Lachnospiraceae bacterium]|nr:class I mannose-6-phosphate isomerase [Lachnospiraceae bacterium]